MAITLGKSSKDSQYLKRIKDAIEGDKDHPRNNGVKMQAHHIISGKGMGLSGLGKKVEKMGYNINLLPNLAFIPCTLQGACHLGVQPHRGNHDVAIDQDDYEDDREPVTYHEMVAKKIQALDLPLSKECPGDHLSKAAKVVAELDGLSQTILRLIQMKPREAPLTKLAVHFGRGGVGCAGVDSVSAHHGGRACPVGRDHLFDAKAPKKSQGEGQKSEKIMYNNAEKYRLKVGQ